MELLLRVAISAFVFGYLACQRVNVEKENSTDDADRLDVQLGYVLGINTRADTNNETNMEFIMEIDGRRIYRTKLIQGKKDSADIDSASGTINVFATDNRSKLKVTVKCNENEKSGEKVIVGDLVTVSADCHINGLPYIDFSMTTKEELEKNGIEFQI